MKHRRASALFVSAILSSLFTACSSGGEASGPKDEAPDPVIDEPDDDDGDDDGDDGGHLAEALASIDLDADLDGDRIVDLPADLDPTFTDLFSRYTALERPEGRIHLLAQAGVGDARIRRTREILAQHLRAVDGTSEGATKSDVTSAMVQSYATVAMFNSHLAASPNNANVDAYLMAMDGAAITLAAGHVVPEGTSAYMAALPAEDRTFGATAALLFETGLAAARPAYAAELRAIRQSMSAAGTYSGPTDLANSEQDRAFLALALDVHSGVWGHDPNGDGTAGESGTLAFASREDLAAGAPELTAWIESFFTADHDFEVHLPEAFTGNFDGLRRNSNPYTARSQHLRNIRMTGTNAGEIFGAPFPSTLVGNAGNNNLKGRAGDDTLEGGDGFDTAVFSGPRANYLITFDGADVIVEDAFGGHDGTDRLTGFERLQFTDGGENL